MNKTLRIKLKKIKKIIDEIMNESIHNDNAQI